MIAFTLWGFVLAVAASAWVYYILMETYQAIDYNGRVTAALQLVRCLVSWLIAWGLVLSIPAIILAGTYLVLVSK